MARLRSENEAEERGHSITTSSSAAAAVDREGVTGAADNKHISIPKQTKVKATNNDNDNSSDNDEEEDMMQLMGFGGFGSTKGKAVTDNQVGASVGTVSKNKGRKYRQYMNRKGGFNRPLDKMN